MPETLYTTFLESPLGWIEITGSETGLSQVTFLEETPATAVYDTPECLQNCISQLKEFFRGERQDFDLKISPKGTDFQHKVWDLLQKIPFGKTASYLDIAKQLCEPTYTRAVGSANGKNPLAIVVPCHRVIGANGSLTGYAGGIWRKKWLLEFENPSPQAELF